MKKYKYDLIFIAALLLLSGILFFQFIYSNSKSGQYVSVYIDGELKDTLKLNADCIYKIENGEFFNVIEVKNDSVSVIEANCRDKICKNHHSISKNKESIICLPHKVVITIESDYISDVDAVAE